MEGSPPDHRGGGGDREAAAEGKACAGAGEGSFRADGRLGGGPRAPFGEDGQGTRGAPDDRTTGARGDHRLFRKRDLPAAGRGATGLSSPDRVPAQDDVVDGGEADGGGARRSDPVGDEPAEPVHQEVSAAGAGLRIPRPLPGVPPRTGGQLLFPGRNSRRSAKPPPLSWNRPDTSRMPRCSSASRGIGKSSRG